MFLRVALALTFFLAVVSHADEKLMKPIAGPGSGLAKGGIRATLSMIKNDFGPGESLMAVWKLTNEGNAPFEFSLNRGSWSAVDFEFRRDGQKIALTRNLAHDRKTLSYTVQPGETMTEMLDLGALDWTDKSWTKSFGNYEVCATLNVNTVQSGWAKFKITAPGEKRPDVAPELAERLRSLIAQLGDAEFATRELAYAQILNLGLPALTMLEETIAGGGRETEVVARCRNLINDIRRANGRPVAPPPPPPPMLPRPPIRPIVPINPPPPPPVVPQPPIHPVDEF
jgi:hypothetical protein